MVLNSWVGALSGYSSSSIFILLPHARARACSSSIILTYTILYYTVSTICIHFVYASVYILYTSCIRLCIHPVYILYTCRIPWSPSESYLNYLEVHASRLHKKCFTTPLCAVDIAGKFGIIRTA